MGQRGSKKHPREACWRHVGSSEADFGSILELLWRKSGKAKKNKKTTGFYWFWGSKGVLSEASWEQFWHILALCWLILAILEASWRQDAEQETQDGDQERQDEPRWTNLTRKSERTPVRPGAGCSLPGPFERASGGA